MQYNISITSLQALQLGIMFSGRWCLLVLFLCVVVSEAVLSRKLKRDQVESFKSEEQTQLQPEDDEREPCQCGVFMSQQVGKERRRWRARGPPTGDPVITYDGDGPELPCGVLGSKHCLSKCIDVMVKYLPRAGSVICGAVERDVHREKAYLYIKNCHDEWAPTSFSAGKEFCCTDGQHHKC